MLKKNKNRRTYTSNSMSYFEALVRQYCIDAKKQVRLNRIKNFIHRCTPDL